MGYWASRGGGGGRAGVTGGPLGLEGRPLCVGGTRPLCGAAGPGCGSVLAVGSARPLGQLVPLGGGHQHHPPPPHGHSGVTPQRLAGPQRRGWRGWAPAPPPWASATGLRFPAPPSLLLLLRVPHLRGLVLALSHGPAPRGRTLFPGSIWGWWHGWQEGWPVPAAVCQAVPYRANTEDRPAPGAGRQPSTLGPCRARWWGERGVPRDPAWCRAACGLPGGSALPRRAEAALSWRGRAAPRMCCSGTDRQGVPCSPRQRQCSPTAATSVTVSLRPCVPRSLCPHIPMSPGPFVLRSPCPHTPVCPSPCVPTSPSP